MRQLVQRLLLGMYLTASCMQAMLHEVEDWQEKLLDPAIASELNFFEVTIASVDQPKLLSRLSEALVRTHQSPSRCVQLSVAGC